MYIYIVCLTKLFNKSGMSFCAYNQECIQKCSSANISYPNGIRVKYTLCYEIYIFSFPATSTHAMTSNFPGNISKTKSNTSISIKVVYQISVLETNEYVFVISILQGLQGTGHSSLKLFHKSNILQICVDAAF